MNKHCKNCGFLWNQHPDGAKDSETFAYIRIMAKNDNPHSKCKCKRFKPMSNLEFLEWKVKHGR